MKARTTKEQAKMAKQKATAPKATAPKATKPATDQAPYKIEPAKHIDGSAAKSHGDNSAK